MICVRQGHRQSEVMHFYVDKYKSSLEKTDYQVVNQNYGEKVLIVPVQENKTAKQFPG